MRPASKPTIWALRIAVALGFSLSAALVLAAKALAHTAQTIRAIAACPCVCFPQKPPAKQSLPFFQVLHLLRSFTEEWGEAAGRRFSFRLQAAGFSAGPVPSLFFQTGNSGAYLPDMPDAVIVLCSDLCADRRLFTKPVSVLSLPRITAGL